MSEMTSNMSTPLQSKGIESRAKSPEDAISEAILAAVAEQRLPAGSKLSEQDLSDLFACNRANVRRAFTRLSALHVVEILPNRGAFVATPSPKEAREIFEARRTIECTLARTAVQRASGDDIADLRRIINEEVQAHARNDKPSELRLSRDFHVRIAKISGNDVLKGFLNELTLRTTLILGLYSTTGVSSCAEDEHDRLVDAIEARDEALFITLMETHLHHLEANLDFNQRPVRFNTVAELLIRGET